MSGVLATRVPTGNELTDRQFSECLQLIRELTGITMSDAKRQLVERRLSMRMKATGTATIDDYLQILRRRDAQEVEQFTNAVTTNLTSFFRENHHFEFFANEFLPARAANTRDRRLRIWSAGCSTGEEPYSISMTLQEHLPDLDQWDARVLCTDIDSEVIATCEAGVYKEERVQTLSKARLRRWFLRGSGARTGQVRVKPALQSPLTFRRLNLMDPWPFHGKFDLIFCRNVIIYFDKPTQRLLVDRFAEQLADGGYLILGHSETLYKVSDRFRLLGRTIFQKTH